MARPKKNTVDFFPHKCKPGKTIFILEKEFKNDGYAFWFKLLELLGSTDNHVLDCRNATTFKFLQAKTLVSEEMACRMLDLLAELEAIDGDLWKKRIIWSDNFVDNLSGVYANRRVEKPTKSGFYKEKSNPA